MWVAVPIADGKDLLDFANWIYQCNLAGEDDGNYPAWCSPASTSFKSGALLDQVLDIVKRDAFGRGSVLFTKFQGSPTPRASSTLVKIVVSMSDNNCPDDTMTRVHAVRRCVLPVTGSSAAGHAA